MAASSLGPRRAAFALLGALAFAAALALVVLGMVFSPLPAVVSAKPAPFGPPLAQHTVLVLVDGLRHDIAHDRARMPHLAERLERYGDAVLWASPVSMTSAAVLLMGTGVRGDLEQIIANESHEPTPFDSIFAALGEAHAPAFGPWTARS
jgi:predicted AlkP superfamily pyrophosphatase or phosphodiesterase